MSSYYQLSASAHPAHPAHPVPSAAKPFLSEFVSHSSGTDPGEGGSCASWSQTSIEADLSLSSVLDPNIDDHADPVLFRLPEPRESAFYRKMFMALWVMDVVAFFLVGATLVSATGDTLWWWLTGIGSLGVVAEGVATYLPSLWSRLDVFSGWGIRRVDRLLGSLANPVSALALAWVASAQTVEFNTTYFPYFDIGYGGARFLSEMVILLPFVRSYCEFRMSTFCSPGGFMAYWSASNIIRAAIAALGILSTLGLTAGRPMDQFSRAVVALIVMAIAYGMALSSNVQRGGSPAYRFWRASILTVWSLTFNSAFFVLRVMGWFKYGVPPSEYLLLNTFEIMIACLGLAYRKGKIGKYSFYQPQPAIPFFFLIRVHALYLAFPTALAIASDKSSGVGTVLFLTATTLAIPYHLIEFILIKRRQNPPKRVVPSFSLNDPNAINV